MGDFNNIALYGFYLCSGAHSGLSFVLLVSPEAEDRGFESRLTCHKE